MSVYAHGSASHCALGYLVSHQTKHVEVPKRVAGISGSVMRVECGKTFTVCLTEQGLIYRWGKDFGLLPKQLSSNIYFSNLHACPMSGEIIAIQKTTDLVFTIHVSGAINKLTLSNGKALHALSVSSSLNSWIVVEAESNSILEIPRNSPYFFVPSLYPASHLLLSPAALVWSAPSGFFASQHASTGEVRVWRSFSVSPAKIIISNCDIGGEWESASCEFSLKHIDAIALPLAGGCCIGYALCRDKTCIVSFDLDKNEGSIFGKTVRFCEPVEWRSIAWDSDGLLAVDLHGVLYLIPHDRVEGAPIELSKCTVVLKQVEAIASSGQHISSIVNIFPHNIHSTQSCVVSLQKLCTESVMRCSVTVENVSNLLELLLDRAVIDLPYLLDCTFSFFLRNRSLISVIAPDAFHRVESRHDFKSLQKFHRGADKISCSLLRLRQEDLEPEISLSVFSPKVTTQLRKSAKPSSPACSTASGSVNPSPVIAAASAPLVSVMLSEEVTESPFNLDDFAPLSDKENFRRASSSSLLDKKVSKWTKHKINKSPPLAPWMHAQIYPAPGTQISPIAQLLSDRTHESIPQSRARTRASRWYTGCAPPPESLTEIIKSEKEKNEEIEAIRLVEEYERFQSQRHAHCVTHVDRTRSRKAPTRKLNCKLK